MGWVTRDPYEPERDFYGNMFLPEAAPRLWDRQRLYRVPDPRSLIVFSVLRGRAAPVGQRQYWNSAWTTVRIFLRKSTARRKRDVRMPLKGWTIDQ